MAASRHVAAPSPPQSTAALAPEAADRLARIEAELAAMRAELRGLRPAPEPALASLPEAARYLGLSRRAVEQRVAAGELASRLLGRRRLVPWPTLRRYAAADHPAPGAHGGRR